MLSCSLKELITHKPFLVVTHQQLVVAEEEIELRVSLPTQPFPSKTLHLARLGPPIQLTAWRHLLYLVTMNFHQLQTLDPFTYLLNKSTAREALGESDRFGSEDAGLLLRKTHFGDDSSQSRGHHLMPKANAHQLNLRVVLYDTSDQHFELDNPCHFLVVNGLV